jgi:hypothetical protein
MKIILSLLIFCLVLFLYLHIYFHLKTSDDLEIYEIEQPSKDKLEEICDLRQPVMFDFNNERLLDSCKQRNVMDEYGAFDVKIRNVKSDIDDEDELYIPLAFSSATNALTEDSDSRYLVENNSDFLEETGLIKGYRYNDAFIRPYMVSNCMYDYMLASNGTRTPFRYEVNYRNYFLVVEGSIKVKLSPPKSSKYLYQDKDYENFEFRSPVNPWEVQQQYRHDFDKIKCLEIVAKRGQMLYIPAYWWYSFEYEDETSLCSFKYRTYMNNVALLPQLFMKLLQSQNVKRTIAKSASIISGDASEITTEDITTEEIPTEEVTTEDIPEVVVDD